MPALYMYCEGSSTLTCDKGDTPYNREILLYSAAGSVHTATEGTPGQDTFHHQFQVLDCQYQLWGVRLDLPSCSFFFLSFPLLLLSEHSLLLLFHPLFTLPGFLLSSSSLSLKTLSTITQASATRASNVVRVSSTD